MKEKVSPTQKMLNVWAIILIVWALYRANFKMPDWFDEFVAKPMVFILPLFYYVQFREKKNFLNSLWLHSKSVVVDLLQGLTIGIVFLASSMAAHFVKYRSIAPQLSDSAGNGIVMVIIMAFATAISEEILSRGFVLKRLYEESRNMYTSIFISSILFFFLHIPILFTASRIGGNMLLIVIMTDMLLSFVTSFVYLQRKSLILPILIHAFYTISIILFI